MHKSVYNIITSIISSIIILILMILIIVFQALKKNILGVVFIPIIASIIITYYIFKTIYYANDNKVIERLSSIFKMLSIILLNIYFILFSHYEIKWLLFSIVLLLGIVSIVFKAINYENIIITINVLFLLITSICIYNIIGISPLYIITLVSNLLFFLNDIFKNKIIDSLEIFTIIPVGILLILI